MIQNKSSENGKINVSQTEQGLRGRCEGTAGHLLLDEDDVVMGFIKDETNCREVEITETDSTILGYSKKEYALLENTAVVMNGELTT